MSFILEARHVTKKFGGLTAVDDVSVGVDKGEVLAILGDNGAGKSTLIKMISGVHSPDSGQIILDGKTLALGNTMEAISAGIETIYQDLALAENLNVFANIFLGRERTKNWAGFVKVLDHASMMEESKKVLEKLDIHIPSLRTNIRSLSGGQRQAVAIARSIYWKAKVLIMDEPTAALGIAEQKKVLDLVNSLKSQGIGIIIISHQMYDVFEVADRIAVLYLGRMVVQAPAADFDRQSVVEYMTTGTASGRPYEPSASASGEG